MPHSDIDQTGAEVPSAVASPPPIIKFLHIPKTGGSSLRWILDRQHDDFLYVVQQWFHSGYTTPIEAIRERGRRPDVVGAHRPLDEKWPEGRTLAMVRDPVRRVLSHLAHIRAEPEAWMPEPVPELELSVVDWIERRPLALFDNNQVRYLSGAREFDAMPMTRAMDESDLDLALAAARTTVLVAPMESFDEALLDWSHWLGWAPPYYRRVNVRRKPGGRGAAAGPHDSQALRDQAALEACNRLDQILCEEVGRLFRERLKEQERQVGRPMAEQLADFRQGNDSAAASARILAHTLTRGLRHPIRAARMVSRTIRQRLKA